MNADPEGLGTKSVVISEDTRSYYYHFYHYYFISILLGRRVFHQCSLPIHSITFPESDDGLRLVRE